MSADTRIRYRFPPLERRGMVAGWRGGQIIVVVAGLVVAAVLVGRGGSAVSLAAAVPAVAVGTAAAFLPLRGRTADQWFPLVARWAVRGARGRPPGLGAGPAEGFGVAASGTVSTAPTDPLPAPAAPPAGRGQRKARERGPFAGLGVEAVSTADRPPVGVIVDRAARTATAVLAVRGRGFALLGPEGQDGRVAAWGRVLAGLAREGTLVHRVQWLESSVPGGGHGIRSWARDRAVLDADHPAHRSYARLLDEAGPEITARRILLAVTLHTGHAARAIRAAGGGRRGTGALVLREVTSLARALDAAEVTVEGVLGPRALSRAVSRAVRPAGSPEGEPAASLAATEGVWAVGPPWPHAVDAAWDSVAVDGTWHATYWIAEWPRVDVGPDFLGPLLLAPVRRTVSLVMEPVSPLRAARQVARARTADIADHELRRRGGFVVTARHHRERAGVEARDAELADGHASYRFAGYVTVTADDRAGLVAARALVEQAAGQAQLELRLLYGEQDRAFLCTLPLGRGLR